MSEDTYTGTVIRQEAQALREEIHGISAALSDYDERRLFEIYRVAAKFFQAQMGDMPACAVLAAKLFRTVERNQKPADPPAEEKPE